MIKFARIEKALFIDLHLNFVSNYSTSLISVTHKEICHDDYFLSLISLEIYSVHYDTEDISLLHLIGELII